MSEESKKIEVTESESEGELFSKERTLQLGGYSPLPRVIRQAKGLSLAAKTVYALLVDYYWNSGEQPIRKLQEKMCYDLGDIDPKTLHKYLEELKDYGLLDWERKGMPARNVYTLNAYPETLVNSRLSQLRNKIPQQDTEQASATNNKVFKDKKGSLSIGPPRPPKTDQNLNGEISKESQESDIGLSPAEAGVVTSSEAEASKDKKELIRSPNKSYLRGDEPVDEFIEYAFVSLIKKYYSYLRQPDYTETTDLCKIFVSWGYVSAGSAPEPEGWRVQHNYCHPYTLAHRLVDEAKGWLRKGINGLKVTIADYERNGESFDFKGNDQSNETGNRRNIGNRNHKTIPLPDNTEDMSGGGQNGQGKPTNDLLEELRQREIERSQKLVILDKGEEKKAAMSNEQWREILKKTAESLKGSMMHSDIKDIANKELREKAWLNTLEREALKQLGKEQKEQKGA